MVAQNAILDRLQQTETGKDAVHDERFVRRDTTEEILEIMASSGTPPVDDVDDRDTKAEGSQAQIDNHGPLAQ